MSSIILNKNVIITQTYKDARDLIPHEKVVEERKKYLIEYLTSLKPYIIIPSIIICSDSSMIIDGHHRYYALTHLGIKSVPVTIIDYSSESIITHISKKISKSKLISAAKNNSPLSPKTSFHHVIDKDGIIHPIILLSPLFRLDNPV